MNAYPELGSGELRIEHFLYYFQATRTFGDNRLVKKGKDKATKDEPDDPDYYKK